MMGLQEIRDLNRQATVRSACTRAVPFVVTVQDCADLWDGAASRITFPFLGGYVPPGWRRTDRDPLFADMSGFGSPHEPAATLRQLGGLLTPGLGYATIEQGQFQGYLAEYERIVLT